jgi:hypothetical protein
MLDRVVQQVYQDRLEEHEIRTQQGHVGTNACIDGHASGPGRDASRSGLKNFGRIQPLSPRFQLAGLQARHVQEIRHVLVQPLRFVDDRKQQVVLRALLEPGCILPQRGSGAQYRRQWCAQIVGHRRHQRGAEPVRCRHRLDARCLFRKGQTLDRDRRLIEDRVHRLQQVLAQWRVAAVLP